MPIKNLTDRESITPRFRSLGKLRKGGEKTPKGYGPDLDHFRFTSADPAIVTAFTEAYGAQPRALTVYLPHPTTEQNFPTWKEAWSAGGLQHRCDGETVTIWLGPDGKYHREPRPCPGGCDEVGRLEVVLPELLAAGFVGTVTLETHSLNDMLAITQVLLKTEELSGGDLRRVQFTLRRVPEKISVPGWGQNTGKRQRVEKWLVKIEPAVDWAQAQMALSRADEQAALPAPSDDWTEDTNAEADAETISAPPSAKTAPVRAVPVSTSPTATPALHWIDNQKVRSGFWANCKSNGMTVADVHTALGVESIHDFTGTQADAVARIKEWLANAVTLEATEAQSDASADFALTPDGYPAFPD